MYQGNTNIKISGFIEGVKNISDNLFEDKINFEYNKQYMLIFIGIVILNIIGVILTYYVAKKYRERVYNKLLQKYPDINRSEVEERLGCVTLGLPFNSQIKFKL